VEQLAWLFLGLVLGANIGFVVLGVVRMGGETDETVDRRM